MHLHKTQIVKFGITQTSRHLELCFRLRKGCTAAGGAQVYRQLVALRENFDELIGTVEQIGQLRQQQHELDGRKGALMQRCAGRSCKPTLKPSETQPKPLMKIRSPAFGRLD